MQFMKSTLNYLAFISIYLLTVLCLCSCEGLTEAGNDSLKMEQLIEKPRILFVVTSHDQIGDTGKATGFYLSEAAHPWKVLKEKYRIDFVSPQGGKAPVDSLNLDDTVNHAFWNDVNVKQKINNTLKPSDINPSDYVAIHYVGGHGAMWDFPDNQLLAEIATAIYENGGVVSAVCHGPAGLINIKLSNGSYLIHGKSVAGFTNEEESAVKLEQVVPFLLEDKLKNRGAKFSKAANFKEHVVRDGRLITGQNPQSAESVGKAVLQELSK